MTCAQTAELIHAYADGELDLVTAVSLESHLRQCERCAAAHRAIGALGAALRATDDNDDDAAAADPLYYRAPADLERHLRARIRQARGAGRGPVARFIGAYGRRIAAAAAVIAILAAVGLLALRNLAGGRADRQLAADVAAAHIRSLMAEHLSDVRSTDRHTVKPWFQGKLDFAPDVRDFRDQSFALEGGRLDYLAGRPVAALVYRHDKHPINLFVWPADPGQPDRPETLTTQQGFALVHWVQNGMTYWAASDMSEATLRRFVSLVRAAEPAAATRAH